MAKNQTNKIILFANIKGGVGKSCLCSMFATYCTEKGIGVAVVDADLQQSLVRQRSREQFGNEEVQVPWQLVPILSSEELGSKTPNDEIVKEKLKRLKAIPGWVLVDCPGTLNDNTLKPVLEAADAVVVPVSYEDIVIDATGVFVKVFRQFSNAPLFFLPNRINDAEGTKWEKEQRQKTIGILGKLGFVAPRIKQSVVMKRFSTLFAFDSYQRKAVEYPFNAIIERIK